MSFFKIKRETVPQPASRVEKMGGQGGFDPKDVHHQAMKPDGGSASELAKQRAAADAANKGVMKNG